MTLLWDKTFEQMNPGYLILDDIAEYTLNLKYKILSLNLQQIWKNLELLPGIAKCFQLSESTGVFLNFVAHCYFDFPESTSY